MSEIRSRTTISVDARLFTTAQQRAKALGYKSFSEYVAYLIEKDLRERGQHITVREESGQWGRTNQIKKDHLVERLLVKQFDNENASA